MRKLKKKKDYEELGTFVPNFSIWLRFKADYILVSAQLLKIISLLVEHMS